MWFESSLYIKGTKAMAIARPLWALQLSINGITFNKSINLRIWAKQQRCTIVKLYKKKCGNESIYREAHSSTTVTTWVTGSSRWKHQHSEYATVFSSAKHLRKRRETLHQQKRIYCLNRGKSSELVLASGIIMWLRILDNE